MSGCPDEDSGNGKDGPYGVSTEWSQTVQGAERSPPGTAKDPVGGTNLGSESVEGSPPGTAKDRIGETNLGSRCVEGNPPDTARDSVGAASLRKGSVEGSPPGTTNENNGVTNKENPEESLKNGETALDSSNWADKVKQMKANKEDYEKRKRTRGESESGKVNGTTNQSPEESKKGKTVTSTPQKDFNTSSSAELQAKKQMSTLNKERKRLPSFGAGDCGNLPSTGAYHPCIHEPLLGADEPSPRVKMKIGQSASELKLPFPS